MAKHRTGHLFRRGKNFYVRWAINGKVFSKALRDQNGISITTKREAEEARTKVMAAFIVADEAAALESIAAKLEGRRTELARLDAEKNPPLPIVRAWSEFLTSSNRPDSSEATLRQYEFQWSAFADWAKAKLGDGITLRDINREVAEDYAAGLNHGRLTAATFNKHVNLLALVFRVLRDKGKLINNPWESPKRGGYIQRKRIISQSRRELTVDELRRVCQRADGELRVLIALGVYTGLRLGDCATLRWAEIDLAHSIVRRIPSKTARRNPKPVIVPIHPSLRELLIEVPETARGVYVLPEIAALYLDRSDLVTDRVQRHFRNCGIHPHKPGTGKDGKRAVVEVGFHSLRHTFVSLCRDSDAPLAVVESIVGHSNPAMTRFYTHVGEGAASRAVAALPSVIGDDHKTIQNEEDVLAKIRGIAQSLSGSNWKEKKAALLALLSDPLEPQNLRP